MDLIGELLAAPFICIGWLIVGAVAGAIAHSIMRSSAPLIGDIALGLVGAVVGGLIVRLLNIYRPEGGIEGVIVSLIVAVVGAVIVIGVVRVLRGQSVTG